MAPMIFIRAAEAALLCPALPGTPFPNIRELYRCHHLPASNTAVGNVVLIRE